jgi:hypothetical protein
MKPVEYRKLYHPSAKIAQGMIKMWLEIYPASTPSSEIKEWNISPKPEMVRVSHLPLIGNGSESCDLGYQRSYQGRC